jgi:glycerol-3-phosphate dehydrogenase
MAKMTVDRLVEREARSAPCRTQDVPLGQAVDADDLARVEGVPGEAYERLARRYGHAAHEVLAVAAERGELAQRVVAGGPPDLLAEAAYAARREQATCVADALLRRTRIALQAARGVVDRGTAIRVAAAMAPELGWDEREREAQAQAFLDEAGAEGITASP